MTMYSFTMTISLPLACWFLLNLKKFNIEDYENWITFLAAVLGSILHLHAFNF